MQGTVERYSRVAMAFHWTIAVLILSNIPLGLLMEGQPRSLKVLLVRTHASIGLTVLVLTLGRIGWRLGHRPPPLPVGMPPWQAGLAHTVHALLYLAMLLMPLTGWGIVAANSKVVKAGFFVFGWLRLPGLSGITDASPARQEAFHTGFDVTHVWSAWILMALLALHIAAALWHQWGDGRGGLSRMLPVSLRRRGGESRHPSGWRGPVL